jgi:ketosteroid isomerase-like protein
MSRMKRLTEHDARQTLAVANTRDIGKMVDLFAEGATYQVPDLEFPLRGKTAIRAFFTDNFAAFPDWTIDVSKVFVSGDETVVVNSVHATHTGPLIGTDGKPIAPTNRKLVQEQMTRVVFDENGKVQSLRAYGSPSELDLRAKAPN